MAEADVIAALRKVAPSYVEEYQRLSELELEIGKVYNKRLSAVAQALNQDWDLRSTIKKLRLYVYNIPFGQAVSPNESLAYHKEDFARKTPAGYTLRIQGAVVNPQKETVANRFSHYFQKVQILIDDETLEWDCSVQESSEQSGVDGIEVVREGETEAKVRILLFPISRVSTFTLSQPLSKVLGNSEASLATCTRGIFNYANRRGLLSTQELGVINTDATLKAIFGESTATVNVADLRALLKPHLMAPRPIELVHTVKLGLADWTDTETTYDLLIESPDVPPPDLASMCTQHTLHLPSKTSEAKPSAQSIEATIRELKSLPPTGEVPGGIPGALNVPAMLSVQQRKTTEVTDRLRRLQAKLVSHATRVGAYETHAKKCATDPVGFFSEVFHTQRFGPLGQLGPAPGNILNGPATSLGPRSYIDSYSGEVTDAMARDVVHAELYTQPWTSAAVPAYLDLLYAPVSSRPTFNTQRPTHQGVGQDGSAFNFEANAADGDVDMA